MEEMKNIPEIRFDGFKEDWETDSFENLTKINQGLQISITNRFKKRIPQSHFYITNEFLKEGAKSEYYILNPPESVLCTNDDVLMTRTGNTGEVVTGVNGAFHNNFFKIKFDREKIDKDYLVYFLKNEATQSLILRLAGVSTIPDLNHNDFYQIEMPFPVDIKEQNKISQLLGNLDSLLKNHNTQLKKLTNLKKAMLIKMFPQDGASVPEIRFKGFDGEWEEKSFSNIINLNSGRDYKHLEKGGIPVYGTGGYMLSVNEALSYDENAIGIGRKGTIDKPYILKAPFWTVDTLFYAIPIGNNDLDFINCLFQKTNWKQKDESTGVPSLSKVTINNTCVSIPKENEQKEIGSYFRTLDSLMENHKEQLKKLNQIKKACLSKLFISQD